MRQFATFVSLVAVVLAAGMSIKHRLPPIFSAYLMSQAIFTLFGWWLSIRVSYSSREYLFFFGTFGVVLVLAISAALYFPLNRWIGLLLITSLGVALFFAGLRIYEAVSRKGPTGSQVMLCLVDGGVLLFCGIMALLSLVEELPPDLRKASLCLGAFWTLQGVFGWVMAATRGKVYLVGVDLNDFAPQFIAIVCFMGLFVMLSGAQPESARQHARDEVSLSELQIEEAL